MIYGSGQTRILTITPNTQNQKPYLTVSLKWEPHIPQDQQIVLDPIGYGGRLPTFEIPIYVVLPWSQTTSQANRLVMELRIGREYDRQEEFMTGIRLDRLTLFTISPIQLQELLVMGLHEDIGPIDTDLVEYFSHL